MGKKLFLCMIVILIFTAIFCMNTNSSYALEVQTREHIGSAEWSWVYESRYEPNIRDMCILQLTSNSIRARAPTGRERRATTVWNQNINTLEPGWYKVELFVNYYYSSWTHYFYCDYYFYYNGSKFSNLIVADSTTGADEERTYSFEPYITANGTEIWTNQFPTFFHVGRSVSSELDIYKIEEKMAPVITLNNPVSGQIVVAEPGLSSFTVDGYIRDGNGDDITLTVDVGGTTKTQIISDTKVAKPFSFSFDALSDGIRPEGTVNLTVHAADNFGKETKVTRTIQVKQRVKHNAYLLINEPVTYEMTYDDMENDLKFADGYKFAHSPTYFDNSMGLISDSGLWRASPYTSFSKPGLYESVYRAQDSPLSDNRFSDFRRWSSESLSAIEFKVHRPPIANFTFAAKSIASYGDDYYYRNIEINDTSYDPDHQNEPGQGISEKKWQYRKLGDLIWIDGKLSGKIHRSTKYEVRLKVRDIDGENGKGVWSDWLTKTVDPYSTYLNALFDVIPRRVSHGPNEAINILDKSVGTISEWRWSITDAATGTELYNVAGDKTQFPTSDLLKSWGIGTYNITLRVYGRGDYYNTLSAPYTVSYEIINNPPEASFTMPYEVYRDTLINPVNLTTDYDLDSISYRWYLNVNGTDYQISTAKNPTFKLVDIIKSTGISANQLLNLQTSLKLRATDSLGATSYCTQEFSVLQHVPVAEIIDNGGGKFTSGAYDNDSDDNSCLIYKWRLIKPDGNIELFSTKNIVVTYDAVGDYTLEHWVIDQIGAKSNTAILQIDKIPPTVTARPESSQWSSTGSTIHVNVTDSSGVSQVKYVLSTKTTVNTYSTTLNASGKSSYSFDVPFYSEGIYYLHVQASDIKGNTTPQPLLFGPYLVDKTSPDISFEYKSGARYINGNHYWTRQGDVICFSVTGTDNLSGTESVSCLARDLSTNPYRIHNRSGAINHNTHSKVKFLTSTSVIDNNEILSVDFPIEIVTHENGAFEIEGMAKDNANCSTGWCESLMQLMIDNKAPSISITPSTYANDDDIYVNIQVSDIGSGIDYLLYSTSTSTEKPEANWQMVKFSGESNINCNIVLQEEGIQYLHVYAFDNVGNSSNKISGPYDINRNSPPQVSIIGIKPSPIYEGDHIEVEIQPLDPDIEPLDLFIKVSNKDGETLYSHSETVYPLGSSYEPVNYAINRIFIIDTGYEVFVQVTDPFGEIASDSKTFEVSIPDIESVTIEGYWNHWRGQKDLFNKLMTDEPHRFLSLETVKINVVTKGYADRIIIRFSPKLESMQYIDKFGHLYDYYQDFGFDYIIFPDDSTFIMDESQLQGRLYWEYTLPLAPSTKSWDDEQLATPYKMTVYVYKGEYFSTYEIDDINITGNVYDLVYIQPVD